MKRRKIKREPSEEIDLLDTMLDSLVDVLEEKGVLTREEYEKRIMEKVKVNDH
jgi:DNA-binding HxlR family transcriptional regulator